LLILFQELARFHLAALIEEFLQLLSLHRISG
jgi:hypothetical protein